jgi:hypothetical protein
MPLLSDIQAKIPTADAVAGQCICYHELKHYTLGQYVGDGLVILDSAGEALLASIDAAAVPAEPEPAPEPVVEAAKPTRRKAKADLPPTTDNDDLGAGLDLSGLDNL